MFFYDFEVIKNIIALPKSVVFNPHNPVQQLILIFHGKNTRNQKQHPRVFSHTWCHVYLHVRPEITRQHLNFHAAAKTIIQEMQIFDYSNYSKRLN